VTRGQLPQRAGLLGLNGGGAAAALPTGFQDTRRTIYYATINKIRREIYTIFSIDCIINDMLNI